MKSFQICFVLAGLLSACESRSSAGSKIGVTEQSKAAERGSLREIASSLNRDAKPLQEVTSVRDLLKRVQALSEKQNAKERTQENIDAALRILATIQLQPKLDSVGLQAVNLRDASPTAFKSALQKLSSNERKSLEEAIEQFEREEREGNG